MDVLTEQRAAAKKRILAAERAGGPQIADLWREAAQSTFPEQAHAVAIQFAEQHYPQELNALLTIPGIGPRTATYLLATLMPAERFLEIGPNGGNQTARNLRRYVGLCPHQEQSGDMDKPQYIIRRRGNAQLRGLLFIATLSQMDKDTPIGDYYRRQIARGKPKRQGLVATSALLLRIAHTMMLTKELYRGTVVKPARPDHLVTQSDAARQMGLSRQRVSQLIKQGTLEAQIWEGRLHIVSASIKQAAGRKAGRPTP